MSPTFTHHQLTLKTFQSNFKVKVSEMKMKSLSAEALVDGKLWKSFLSTKTFLELLSRESFKVLFPS